MICNLNDSLTGDTSLLKLKTVISSDSNKKYSIMHYDKDILCVDLIPTHGIYRSVIKNEKGQAVCIAPPKAIHSDNFIKTFPNPSENGYAIIAEEFIEGTMINVFWDNGWEIATKLTIGSINVKSSSKSKQNPFYKMFIEACSEVGLTFDMLQHNYCYSFVLQHPRNKIVLPITKPMIYLVQVFEIINRDQDIAYIYVVDKSDIILPCVKKPKIYENWTSYSDLIRDYASMNTSYDILGVMIYDKIMGQRCKIRNPVYEELHRTQYKMQYLYLSLRKEGKVKEFLSAHPECKNEFCQIRDQLHLFTNAIFQNYLSCYIKKEKTLQEFPKCSLSPPFP